MKHTLIMMVFVLANNLMAKSIEHTNQFNMTDNLNKQEKHIVTIAATTAIGNIDGLKTALHSGLDAKLSINQINEVLTQMYAYAGFPRSLTGINIFMAIVDERKSKGIIDEVGKMPSAINEGIDKYERGRKVLEELTKQPQSKPAKGFGEFNPAIDRFLKEHLFADIFDSDVLSYQQRELATIAALASMPGVEPMLQSHLNMGMNVGLTQIQLNDLFIIIENKISKKQADGGRVVLAKVLASRKQ